MTPAPTCRICLSVMVPVLMRDEEGYDTLVFRCEFDHRPLGDVEGLDLTENARKVA